MVDGIRQPGEHHQPNERRVERQHTDHHEDQRFHQQADDKNHARTNAVDEKAHRRLRQGRGDAESGDGQTKLGEADAVDVAQQWKQRRQRQQIEMAEEVRRANKPNDLGVSGYHTSARCVRGTVSATRADRLCAAR